MAGEVVMNRKYAATEIRKEQIINAAADLIVGWGGEHLTIKNLAAHIGLSEAAIYRHFRTKTEIYHFLIRHMQQMLLEELHLEELQMDNRNITVNAIRSLIFRHVEAIERTSAVEFQAMAEIISIGDRSLYADMHNMISQYIAGIRCIIEEGRTAGLVKKEVDPFQAALLLFSIISGLANLWVLNEGSFKLSRRFRELWPLYSRMVFSASK